MSSQEGVSEESSQLNVKRVTLQRDRELRTQNPIDLWLNRNLTIRCRIGGNGSGSMLRGPGT